MPIRSFMLSKYLPTLTPILFSLTHSKVSHRPCRAPNLCKTFYVHNEKKMTVIHYFGYSVEQTVIKMNIIHCHIT